MAKLKSLIKIEGTLDDLTFYKGRDGFLVRTKGGVSKSRIAKDPAFARTRENGSEFGMAATSGKMLRRAILDLMVDAKDGLVTSRLTRVMTLVKNEDAVSPRGARNVAVGITTPQGKLALKGFNFNNRAIMSAVVLSDINLTMATGEIIIPDFIPAQRLYVPEGSTHVSLISGYLNLDFITGDKDLQLSPVSNMPIDNTSSTVTLTPAAVPTGAGAECYFLKVAFYQEINGIQYPLNNGAYNALQLLEVL
ncbi:hypothetical protein [Gelidibacter mesophilus]|uniref:hypothetical protein n=1 Tax=Gelidibacter mesophilus TaxID=169050 RepID=UPI000412BE7F|nr:hypothetical protein [Gelidibacter mesophilus]